MTGDNNLDARLHAAMETPWQTCRAAVWLLLHNATAKEELLAEIPGSPRSTSRVAAAPLRLLFPI